MRIGCLIEVSVSSLAMHLHRHELWQVKVKAVVVEPHLSEALVHSGAIKDPKVGTAGHTVLVVAGQDRRIRLR